MTDLHWTITCARRIWTMLSGACPKALAVVVAGALAGALWALAGDADLAADATVDRIRRRTIDWGVI